MINICAHYIRHTLLWSSKVGSSDLKMLVELLHFMRFKSGSSSAGCVGSRAAKQMPPLRRRRLETGALAPRAPRGTHGARSAAATRRGVALLELDPRAGALTDANGL